MEFNLLDFAKLLIRKWWIMLICVLLCGGGAYVVTNYYMVPYYTAYTVYVGVRPDEAGMNVTDLNIGAAVVGDYSQIAKSRSVASKVIERLDLTDVSAEALADSIYVEQISETRIIEIAASHINPYMAMEVTNTVAEVFMEKIQEIMHVTNVSVIDRAEIPHYPSSPNKGLNYIIGILLGLVTGAGIIYLINYMDKSVKTTEDVEKYTGLTVIGTIPAFHTSRKGY